MVPIQYSLCIIYSIYSTHTVAFRGRDAPCPLSYRAKEINKYSKTVHLVLDGDKRPCRTLPMDEVFLMHSCVLLLGLYHILAMRMLI